MDGSDHMERTGMNGGVNGFSPLLLFFASHRHQPSRDGFIFVSLLFVVVFT